MLVNYQKVKLNEIYETAILVTTHIYLQGQFIRMFKYTGQYIHKALNFHHNSIFINDFPLAVKQLSI